jgi:hypothetical protein
MLLNDPSLAQSPETNPERERNTLNRLRDSTAAKITAGTLTVVAGLGIANIFSGPESATVIEVTELDIDNDGIADVRTTTEVLGGETTDEAIEQELTAPEAGESLTEMDISVETSEVTDPEEFPFMYFSSGEERRGALQDIIDTKSEEISESTAPGFRGYVVGTVESNGQQYWVQLHNPVMIVSEGNTAYWVAPLATGELASVEVGRFDDSGGFLRVKSDRSLFKGQTHYYSDPANGDDGQQVRFTPQSIDGGSITHRDDYAHLLSENSLPRVSIESTARLFSSDEEVFLTVGRELSFKDDRDQIFRDRNELIDRNS